MVQPLGDVDAFAGGQADLSSGGDCVGSAVRMDGDVGSVVDGFIRQRVVYPDQHISAAPVDNVLGFVPVEMIGGVLALLQEQQFFGIDLGVLFPHGLAAVADGDKGEANFIEIALAVVGDVPAQAALPDLVIRMAFRFPFLRGEIAEGGQIATVLFTHGLQLLQSLVDFGTLHKRNSPSFILCCLHIGSL